MEFRDILPVLERAYAFGLRDKHVCDLTGISAGTLSRAKNGSEHLSGQDWLDCKNLIADCEELVRRNSLPINWTDLRAVRLQLDQLESERKSPPNQPSEDDWKLLGATTPERMQAVAKQLGITIPELLARVEEALKRFNFVVHSMRRASAESLELAALNREEFEQRRSSS